MKRAPGHGRAPSRRHGSAPSGRARCAGPLGPRSGRGPGVVCLVSAITAALGGRALAAGSVRISLTGAASFSAAELEDAVRARVPVARRLEMSEAVDSAGAGRPEAAAGDGEREMLVTVAPAAPRTVWVRAGQREQVVELGDQRGGAAARVVALVIADLIGDELAPPAGTDRQVVTSPARRRAATVSAPPPLTISTPLTVGRSILWSETRWRMAVTAGTSKGIGSDESLCLRAEADAGRPLVGGLVLGSALGVVVIPERNRGRPDALSYTAAVARAWAGWRSEPLEAGVGPFLSPYAIGGATPHTGVLAGAGVLARLVTPLSARLRLIIAARADGYLNRVHTTWLGSGGFATPRLDLALTAGLGWDAGP